MFGHVAQMPQLLRLAGLEHAVVWRGVPAEIDRTAFWWEAPDGSRVRAEYLYGSYSNGRDLPDDAKQLVARAHGYEMELGPALLADGSLLLMNGTDHQLPQPWLGRVVAEANADPGRLPLRRHVARRVPARATDRGTARLAWRAAIGRAANVLMGVASNRVDVHQACAAAERAVERRAEPLSALFLAPERYPTRLLDVAWRNLVLNSAHDSSCACSHDEVVDAVMVRYQEARHVGEGLARDAARRLAAEIDAEPGSTVVINPTQHDRTSVIDARVPGEGAVHFVADDGTRCPAQVLRTVGGDGFSTTVTGQKVRWVLEMLRGPEFAGRPVTRVERHTAADGSVDVTFHAAGPDDPRIDLEEMREELLELGERGATIRFRQVLAPTREVLLGADAVPGFGWRTYRAVEGEGPKTGLIAGFGMLANDHLRVTVDPDDGTFSVSTEDGVEVNGLNRLVDGGDGGDTYNYSPPDHDLFVSKPDWVRINTLESGPVRARLLIVAVYQWPSHAVGNERWCVRRGEETALVEVRTTLELHAHERFVRVRVEFDNRCRDHRLRAHFPLPAPVDRSAAECAFAVVERGLTTEGGPHELPLPTFVSRRFVDGSDGEVGLAVLHDGLLEYEVVEDGTELALTLLRATGYLSRTELQMRPNPAGPIDPLEGPQLQHHHVVEYALLPHRGDWREARPARRRRRVPRAARARAGWRTGRAAATDRADPPDRGCDRLGGDARARWPRRPDDQPVSAGDDRDRGGRRRAGHGLDRRSPRRPAGVLHRRRDARPVGDRDAASGPRARGTASAQRVDVDRLVEAGDRARPEGDDVGRPDAARHFAVDHDLAGAGGPDETRRQVHDGAEHVPFPDEHLAGREPDPDRRETLAPAHPLDDRAGDVDGLGGVARDEHGLVADQLDQPGAGPGQGVHDDPLELDHEPVQRGSRSAPTTAR